MTVLRRLAILGMLLIAAMPSAWAQLPTAISMVAGNSFSIEGIKLTVNSCSVSGIATSYTTGTTPVTSSCSNDVLDATNGNRGGISFQLHNVTPASNALNDTASHNSQRDSNPVTMTFTLLVHDNGSSKVVTDISKTTVGIASVPTEDCSLCGGLTGTRCVNGDQRTANATTTSSKAFTTTLVPGLVDALTVTGTTTPQTILGGVHITTPGTGDFTITETITLDNDHDTNAGLSIKTVTYHFTTTPEPASIVIMGIALGGLAVARRRKNVSV